MELSIQVSNGWLHISNHPWTPVIIKGTQDLEPNHASLTVTPSSAVNALPQLTSLAQKAHRQLTLRFRF